MGLFDWLRSRRDDGSPEAAPVDSGQPDPERPGSPEAGASLDGAVRADWATVPAMRAAVPPIEPVVDRRFDRSLASWQSPLVLRQLDHAVSSDAPSGLVLARAHRDAQERVAQGLTEGPAVSSPTVTTPAAVQRVVALDGPRRPAPVVAVPSRPLPVTTVREPASGAPAPSGAAVPPVQPPDTSAAVVAAITPPDDPVRLDTGSGPEVPSMVASDERAGTPPAAPTVDDAFSVQRAVAIDGPGGPVAVPLDVAPLVGASGAPTDAGGSPDLAAVEGSTPAGGLGAPLVSRDADGGSRPVGAPTMPGGRPTIPASGRLPAEAHPGDRGAQAPAPGAVPPTAAAPEATAPTLGIAAAPPGGGSTGTPVVQRLAEGAAAPPRRRAGLGAPLPSVPPSAGTAVPVEPIPTGDAPVGEFAVRGDGSDPGEPGVRVEAFGPGPVSDHQAVAPLLGDRPSESTLGPLDGPLDGPGDGPLDGPLAGPVDGPLEDPSRAVLPVVQRHAVPDAGTAPDGAADTVPDALEPVGAVVLQRAADETPATAALLGDRAPVSSVRSPFAPDVTAPGAVSAVSPAPATARSLEAPGTADRRSLPSVQRAVPGEPSTGGAPSTSSGGGSSGAGSPWPASDRGPWVDAGAVAVASGVAQRHADGSVVFDAPADDEPVQREAADGGSGSSAGGAGSAGAAGSPGAAAASGAELDELAKRLYGRMRLLLKQELRHDRERAGSLTRTRR